MKRMFGMMPSNSIKIEKRFRLDDGKEVTIQAGEEGWTIIYDDHSTEYQDVESSSELNFGVALQKLRVKFGGVTLIEEKIREEEG